MRHRKPSRRRILLSYIDGEASDMPIPDVYRTVARAYRVNVAAVVRLVIDACGKGWAI